MVMCTKMLLDDKLSNPRSHVTMSPKDLVDLNRKFMTKLKAISKWYNAGWIILNREATGENLRFVEVYTISSSPP